MRKHAADFYPSHCNEKDFLPPKLIEPVDISLSFIDGERFILQGLYTASLDAFRELDDATVLQLVRAGHAQLIYAMNVSLQQVSRLAALRNARGVTDRRKAM